MSNYHIGFSLSPYLLFLIIPALLFIWGAFFIGKKGRLSRFTLNRIIASVLQSAVAILCIFALSGIQVSYDEINPQNELVILVDRSFTAKQTQSSVDDFLYEIFEANKDRCSIALVTFGFDQKLVLKPGKYSAAQALEKYRLSLSDEPVDETATDIAAALRFVYDPDKGDGVIRYPQTAKVLIVSDGLQTDGDAMSEVRSLTLDGIRVDTAFYPTMRAEDDASVVKVEFPDHSITEGEEFKIELEIKSSYFGTATLSYLDKDENGSEIENTIDDLSVKMGSQNVAIPYSFVTPGLHELKFTLATKGDMISQNNSMYSYYEVKENNKILVLETYVGESSDLVSVIEERFEGDAVKAEIVQIDKAVSQFRLEDLAKYGEIILYNISQNDLPDQFQSYLYDFANKLGGGVFTVGGFQKENGEIVTQPKYSDPTQEVPVSNAYREDDPADSVYSNMLPITVEPYTPGVGVVFVCDISASMLGAFQWRIAQEAVNSLELLSPRDYVGLVYIEDSYQSMGNMLPMTRKSEIVEMLSDIENARGNGTHYEPGLRQAVNLLSTLPPGITKRHIVFCTDGGPSDPAERYTSVIREAHEKMGVTLTVMQYYVEIIDGKYENGFGEKTEDMLNLARIGEGSVCYIQQKNVWFPDYRFTEEEMKPFKDTLEKDLKLEELKDVDISDFSPRIQGDSPILNGITATELDALTLNGYFPSRAKLHGDVETSLLAKSSPLYAEWQVGMGRVGSIMIDLEGYWSNDLLNSDVGRRLIYNIVSHLLRKVEEIVHSLELSITEDNYRTQVNVYGFEADKEKDCKLVAIVLPPSGGGEVAKFDLSDLSKTQNRFSFVNSEVGIYVINVYKVPQNFNVFASKIAPETMPQDEVYENLTGYRCFSYSKEFDQTLDAFSTGKELMLRLSTRAVAQDDPPEAKFVYDAETIFEDYGIEHIVSDPRQSLLIAALVLFLASIAFRRFKIRIPKKV